MDLLSLPPETLEQIFLALPPKSLLKLQRIKRGVQQFIFSSPKLRASVFLDPLPAASITTTTTNSTTTQQADLDLNSLV